MEPYGSKELSAIVARALSFPSPVLSKISGGPSMLRAIWLIRHGETEWSLSGAHTGRTDLPLTENGRNNGRALGRYFAGRTFALVLTSPLSRARETCRLAGYGDVAQVD